MATEQADPVNYWLLNADGEQLLLNDFIGKKIRLNYQGIIHCTSCGRKTKKSFNGGHCFPCFKKLASCDVCMVSPEKCHFDQGTCREPEWAEKHCMQPHTVYLANSSGLKVGITRMPIGRWIDQGAAAALPLYQVSSRYISGLLETHLKQFYADKTNWRKMLKNEQQEVDLVEVRDQAYLHAADYEQQLIEQFGEGSVIRQTEAEMHQFSYPSIQWPIKVTSFNFDKQAEVEGTLHAIKGQYLILDTGVINIRKFAGYDTEVFSD